MLLFTIAVVGTGNQSAVTTADFLVCVLIPFLFKAAVIVAGLAICLVLACLLLHAAGIVLWGGSVIVDVCQSQAQSDPWGRR